MLEQLLNFKKLKTKEKTLILGFIIVILGSLYFNMVYKPLTRSISRYEFQVKKSRERLESLRQKLPELGTQRQNIQFLEKECQKILDEVSKIESSLPNKKSISELLTKLVQLGSDLKIASVRQKLDESGEYSSIYIELKFNAPYINTVNYLRKVEAISPFLVIQELDITEETTKITRGGPAARLILSGLLGEISTAELIKAAESEPLSISRNIFVSKEKPMAEIKKIDLRIEGITYNLKTPTAIIGGEVVRVGSEVEGYTVEDIRPDSVLFSDGFNDYLIEMER